MSEKEREPIPVSLTQILVDLAATMKQGNTLLKESNDLARENQAILRENARVLKDIQGSLTDIKEKSRKIMVNTNSIK